MPAGLLSLRSLRQALRVAPAWLLNNIHGKPLSGNVNVLDSPVEWAADGAVIVRIDTMLYMSRWWQQLHMGPGK